MDVPLWVLRHTAYPMGKRYEKLKKFERPHAGFTVIRGGRPDQCVRCSTSLAEPGKVCVKRNGFYYCAACIRELNKLGREPQVLNAVIKGNLEETEYAFWIGMRLNYVLRATCRACGHITYSEEDRESHKKAHDPACTVLLVHAYKNLLRTGKCIVCRCQTIKSRWGVPLCGQTCIEKFKFEDEVKYIPLEVEILQVRKSGGFITSAST